MIIPKKNISIPKAVDLGLSVKWASFNLGASKPEEYGDYIAWGDTSPYYSSQNPLTWNEGKESGYKWASYKWCKGAVFTLTKYCDQDDEGYNGFTDKKTILDLEDDTATVVLGNKWRMPTSAEWDELIINCTWNWVIENGVGGMKVTSRVNGNSIFFPAAGERWTHEHGADSHDTNLRHGGSYGYYWSSSLGMTNSINAWCLNFGAEGKKFIEMYRCRGFPIRPVYAE